MSNYEVLFAALEERLELAEVLLTTCAQLEEHVEGKQKLRRKIKAEIHFLSSIKSKSTPIKPSHVQSTNLSHLSGVVKTAMESEGVVSLFTTFNVNLPDSLGYSGSVCCIVDVVACGGKQWFKVIARNPLALHRVWQGEGEYGERDLVDQAQDFIDCSKHHTIHFQSPLISFLFCNGVTQSLASKLTEMGISVQGEVLVDPGETSLSPLPVIVQPSTLCIKCLNLDVSTMIAYVSGVTNGGAMFIFKDGIINSQAERERKEPLLPKLTSYFEDKTLIACVSAIDNFKEIVQTIGGPNEKERATKLLERINEMPDDPSERALNLITSASIKPRSKVVFGTGDKLKAITISANSAFVRAAGSQGVNFSVFTHQSRALTEAKERDATPIAQS